MRNLRLALYGIAVLALYIVLVPDSAIAQQATRVTNLVAATASSYLTVRLSDGTNFLTVASDATHDSAASATGPNILGDCDDTATDAVDEGDAGRARIDCTTRALRAAPMASAVGGATTLKYTVDNSDNEDEHAVCSAACTLYSITVTNVSAAAAFLRCENDTTANTTPGSETPELDLAIPGATTGAGFTVSFPVGANFATALTCWVATGEADSSTADAGVDDIKLFYTLKQ